MSVVTRVNAIGKLTDVADERIEAFLPAAKAKVKSQIGTTNYNAYTGGELSADDTETIESAEAYYVLSLLIPALQELKEGKVMTLESRWGEGNEAGKSMSDVLAMADRYRQTAEELLGGIKQSYAAKRIAFRAI